MTTNGECAQRPDARNKKVDMPLDHHSIVHTLVWKAETFRSVVHKRDYEQGHKIRNILLSESCRICMCESVLRHRRTGYLKPFRKKIRITREKHSHYICRDSNLHWTHRWYNGGLLEQRRTRRAWIISQLVTASCTSEIMNVTCVGRCIQMYSGRHLRYGRCGRDIKCLQEQYFDRAASRLQMTVCI